MKNIATNIIAGFLTLSSIGCATTSRAELEKSVKDLQKSIDSLEKTIEQNFQKDVQSNNNTSNSEDLKKSSSYIISPRNLEINGPYIPKGTEVIDYRENHFVIYRTVGNIELNNSDTWNFEYKTPTMWRWLPAISSQENELAIISMYKEAGLIKE